MTMTMSIRSSVPWLRRHLRALAIGAVVLALATVVIRGLPRPVNGLVTLDECYWGWPVVVFEGEAWRDAIPDDLGASAPRAIPVATWPDGLRYDERAEVLVDGTGAVVLRRGDRLRIAGSVVRTSRDPAPCFYTVGVAVHSIEAP